jgi:hypothetical protein
LSSPKHLFTNSKRRRRNPLWSDSARVVLRNVWSCVQTLPLFLLVAQEDAIQTDTHTHYTLMRTCARTSTRRWGRRMGGHNIAPQLSVQLHQATTLCEHPRCNSCILNCCSLRLKQRHNKCRTVRQRLASSKPTWPAIALPKSLLRPFIESTATINAPQFQHHCDTPSMETLCALLAQPVCSGNGFGVFLSLPFHVAGMRAHRGGWKQQKLCLPNKGLLRKNPWLGTLQKWTPPPLTRTSGKGTKMFTGDSGVKPNAARLPPAPTNPNSNGQTNPIAQPSLAQNTPPRQSQQQIDKHARMQAH